MTDFIQTDMEKEGERKREKEKLIQKQGTYKAKHFSCIYVNIKY